MNWSDLAGPSPKARAALETPVAKVRYLPMELTADEALGEWDAHWLRVTNPEHTGGEALHLSAYRERFERLVRQEETGVVAQPVELPAPPREQQPSENVLLYRLGRLLVPREGTHLASNQRARMTRAWLKNKRAKGELV